MCLDILLKLFSKPVTPPVVPPVIPPPSPPIAPPDVVKPKDGLYLTHPQEPMNPAQTVANTNTDEVMAKWFEGWNVPADSQDFFKSKVILKVFDLWPPEVTTKWPSITSNNPAFTITENGVRYLYVLSAWLNPGVIAHEQAHNSYALLSVQEKDGFDTAFDKLKNTDPLLVYLWKVNSYGLTNNVEGHAETYRYIGDRMPEELKIYYPKLFKEEL